MTVFIAVAFLLAQGDVGASTCQRLDTNRSAQYISFVRWGPDASPDGKGFTTKAWLKIHNIGAWQRC
jgi:hypothetical protein